MLPRPEFNALLLITHPGGARSFDYEDRWENEKTLIYTGRGKTGDQRLTGPNLDVAQNRRTLILLEAVEARRLRFLGIATCIDSWTARAADAAGQQRDVWKFRLAMDRIAPVGAPPSQERGVLRRPRPFSPNQPTPRVALAIERRTTPEETAALQEKANQEHHRTLARLATLLEAAGWRKVQEIPAAVDLWATCPDGRGRVIFEVKTLTDANEVHQCRGALAAAVGVSVFPR